MHRSLAALLCSAAVMLGIGGLSLDPSRLHISGMGHGLNDQVNYIATARNLVDTGRLESTLVYPSVLRQEGSRNTFYMPGHALALAGSYYILGHGTATYLLPNLIAFLIASVCVWLLAARLYGDTAALMAGMLFVCFPANIVYAWTAMAELTLVAAGAAILCAAAYLPWRLRPWIAPLLIAIPFVFRETAAILYVPIAALVLRSETEVRRVSGLVHAKNLAIFTALTALVLGLVYRSWFSQSRGSLIINNLFGENADAIYRDAYFTPSVPVNLSTIFEAVVDSAHANGIAFWLFITHQHALFEFYTILSLGIAAAVLIASPWLLRKFDLFVIAAGFVVVGLFVAIFSLYTIDGLRGLRMLLIATPPVAVAGGYMVKRLLVRSFYTSKDVKRASWIVIGFLVIVGGTTVLGQRGPFRASDSNDDNASAFLESIEPDPTGLLVAPWYLSSAYLYKHYPVKWSFLPANNQTLVLLNERHPIHTLVLPEGWLNGRISASLLHNIGLQHADTLSYWPFGSYDIFRPRDYEATPQSP